MGSLGFAFCSTKDDILTDLWLNDNQIPSFDGLDEALRNQRTTLTCIYLERNPLVRSPCSLRCSAGHLHVERFFFRPHQPMFIIRPAYYPCYGSARSVFWRRSDFVDLGMCA
eukprot:scaffold174824_cov22-Prasinocladus_malaysianus.AAC.1